MLESIRSLLSLGRLRGAHRRLGRRAEALAARHLRQQGYRILARNLRTPSGEIDILAEAPDRRTVVVVEVKGGGAARGSGDGGNEGPRPEWHVTADKQRRLVVLAVQAVRRFNLGDRPLRFDVVAVEFPRRQRPQVRHWPGAFQARV